MCAKAATNSTLRAWFNEKRAKMPFKTPVVLWSDPDPHDPANCYVCSNDVTGLNRRKKLNLSQKQVEILSKELKKAKLLAPNENVTMAIDFGRKNSHHISQHQKTRPTPFATIFVQFDERIRY